MSFTRKAALAAAAINLAALPVMSTANDNRPTPIPSVIITVENSAGSRGAFQTPFWIAAHDGSFDIYDRDVPLGSGSLISAASVEALAEDGATGPISEEFSIAQPLSPQTTLVGQTGSERAGPVAPGITSSVTFNVNPETDRFFSYASMVIPSNDAFIANGNPQAHPLFDERGRFVGEDFVVAGSEVLDAGTEINDEIAANTAFLNQGGPNIGDTENGNVVLHEGFRTDLTYPDGVLNHPVFAAADFLQPTYRAASFSFRFVDLARTQLFSADLSPENEVTGPQVVSNASGVAFALSRRGERVAVRVSAFNLTGPATMVHLHLGPEGVNGPIVANLTDGLRRRGTAANAVIRSADVLGPLADAPNPFLALLNEIAAGNVYVNVHTAANPAGELRGQLNFR